MSMATSAPAESQAGASSLTQPLATGHPPSKQYPGLTHSWASASTKLPPDTSLPSNSGQAKQHPRRKLGRAHWAHEHHPVPWPDSTGAVAQRAANQLSKVQVPPWVARSVIFWASRRTVAVFWDMYRGRRDRWRAPQEAESSMHRHTHYHSQEDYRYCQDVKMTYQQRAIPTQMRPGSILPDRPIPLEDLPPPIHRPLAPHRLPPRLTLPRTRQTLRQEAPMLSSNAHKAALASLLTSQAQQHLPRILRAALRRLK